MMFTLLKSLATPLTAGLFLVSAVSGAALFFHVGQGSFREMHEWLSMALLIPAGLHLSRNWTPLLGYLRRGRLLLPVGACVLVALGFAGEGLLAESGHDNPGSAAVDLLLKESLSAVAPVTRTDSGDLAEKLRAKGYTIPSAEATLLQIAVASGREPPQIVSDLAAMTMVTPRL